MLYDPKWEVETKPKLEPWRQLLLDAADYMEQHGHAKCSVLEADGSVCLVGALSIAAYGRPDRFLDDYCGSRNTPMVQAFEKMRRHVDHFPVQWNNDPNRSGEEVVAGMRACANGA